MAKAIVRTCAHGNNVLATRVLEQIVLERLYIYVEPTVPRTNCKCTYFDVGNEMCGGVVTRWQRDLWSVGS